MPRPGQVKTETEERLPDRIAVGLLTRTFPPELVDRVVADCGAGGTADTVAAAACGGVFRAGDVLVLRSGL